MAVALRKRLAEQKEEVLGFTKRFGVYQAADKFECSLLAFEDLIEEWTGEKNYGRNPEISLTTHQSIGDQLVEAILRKINILQSENEKLKEQLKILRLQSSESYKKVNMAEQIDRILIACGVENE